jgi:hypothetical protein
VYEAASMSSKEPPTGWDRLEMLRARAEEADAKAAQANDPQVQLTWTQIAQSWRLLADYLARQLKLYE